MKAIWQNAFERLANADHHAEMFAYYDESMKKVSIARMEFFTLASRFASILRASGVQRGDVILCALPLCPEGAVINYGALFAGATIIHSEYMPDNPILFMHCVKESRAKFIAMRNESFDATWSEFKDKTGTPNNGCLTASFSDSRLPNVKKVILVERGGDNDFMSCVKSHGGCYVDRDVSEDQLAAFYLTSGTTGVPKLVMRSHKSLVLDALEGVLPASVAPTGKARRFYHNAPWSWVVASSFDMLDGYTRVHPDLWHAPKDRFKMYKNIIQTDGVGYMFMPPPELESIQKIWTDSSRKIARMLMVAGFPVTHQLCKWMLTCADGVCVRFGCSEMISICYNVIKRLEDFEEFDCGVIYPGTTVRAVNDKMEDVPKGTPGRLLMKCQSMFDGYMGQPEKTAEALDNGWYVTTDAGYIDNKNHLFIIGRYDYIIRNNGHIYYPSSIEKIIREHPQVEEVVVVPIPNGQNEHNACAYIVKVENSKISGNDIIKMVKEAARKENIMSVIPPQHVIFVDSIARSDRGKINRNKLIDEAAEIIKSL